MPIYEYRCQACNERFEKLVHSGRQDNPQIQCPACQSEEIQRLISAPAVHKGGQSQGTQEPAESPAAQPAVFGRKELNEVLRSKDS